MGVIPSLDKHCINNYHSGYNAHYHSFIQLNFYERIHNMKEVLNARITSVSLGYGDHCILTFGLGLEISGGGCCVFGGYALDNYDKELEDRFPTAAGFECLTKIMETVGVGKWEDLKGQYIRVVYRGLGNSIIEIGNILEDRWFNIENFFKERE